MKSPNASADQTIGHPASTTTVVLNEYLTSLLDEHCEQCGKEVDGPPLDRHTTIGRLLLGKSPLREPRPYLFSHNDHFSTESVYEISLAEVLDRLEHMFACDRNAGHQRPPLVGKARSDETVLTSSIDSPITFPGGYLWRARTLLHVRIYDFELRHLLRHPNHSFYWNSVTKGWEKEFQTAGEIPLTASIVVAFAHAGREGRRAILSL